MQMSQLNAFIKAHHMHFTIIDFMEETGVSRHVLMQVFDRLGLTPASRHKIYENFIEEMRGKISMEQICKRLDLQSITFKKIYLSMGLIKADFELSPSTPGVSVRHILGDYSVDGAKQSTYILKHAK